ncbi:MAG: hypothetical protein ACFE9Z_09560 [Promethearchaeota archaeon]
MGLNSRVIEKRVEHFLQTIFNANNTPDRKQIQRKKFILLSKLVADLFKNKNSQVCFNNISSLIMLILNIYNEKFPIDIYSVGQDIIQKAHDSKFKQILKQEFLIE